jgi:hypothetical protein
LHQPLHLMQQCLPIRTMALARLLLEQVIDRQG